jgi:dihydroneopterin aldolase
MLSVHLHKVLFHAKHGLHAEEKITGNSFEVSLEVKYLPPVESQANPHHFIDYVALFQLVQKRMQEPSGLLEQLVIRIAADILAQFPEAAEVNISIKKQHPPLLNFEGSVGVSYSHKR